MTETINTTELANTLDDIAEGRTFSEMALYTARELPWTTGNDRAMLTRYLYGTAQAADYFALQVFSILTRNNGE